MNIKEHIEAGHYPKDEKGRAVVPTNSGQSVLVYAADAPGGLPLVGHLPDYGITTWHSNGDWGGRGPAHDLLPPAPRKVKVTAWALKGGCGQTLSLTDDAVRAKNWPTVGAGYWALTLTGEYEEPWS